MSKKSAKSGEYGGPGADWAKWLVLIPKSERTRMVQLLKSHPIETLADLKGFTRLVLIEVLEGNITPAVADLVRKYLEMMLTMTTAEMQGSASGMTIDALLVASVRQEKREERKELPQHDVFDALAEEREKITEALEVSDNVDSEQD